LHSGRPQKKPRREAALSFCSLTSRKGLAAWRSPHQSNRQRWGSSIGGKPLTQLRAEPLVAVSDGRHEIAEKPLPDGLRNLLRAISILRSMSATLAKQFQDYAARCLELARAARTTAGRARFMQMAREYQSAASLIHTELSADGGADRAAAPGSGSPFSTRSQAAHPPTSPGNRRAMGPPQPCLCARSP